MKGRSGIRGLELKKKRKNETDQVRGLWSVPDDVFVECLTQLSRLDLVALAMVSKRHRGVGVAHGLRKLRSRRGCLDPYMYVYMHMYPDPSPRWFVLHPVQRRLKRLNMNHSYPAPVAGSCFVKDYWGVYVIGGLVNGKPTSEVTFFDCTDHTVCRLTPMKMARSGASASLIDGKKIYVFGGCWEDAADSSNWAEVYDVETGIWEFLSVVTPKMPLKIQQSFVMDDQKHAQAVDEDGQIFNFSSTECKFEAAEDGRTESNPSNWLFADQALFCPASGGRILWRFPFESDWKEVKGLEQLQQQHSGFHVIKLSISGVRLAIFWESRPQGPDGQILELWYAELSIATRGTAGVFELSVANIEWSAAVLSLDSSSSTSHPLNLLFADSFYL